MFAKLLIANRGEIACRVIKTARMMGIHTIAVYSDADRNARHVEMAAEAVHIGGSAPSDSYLNMEKVLAAAKLTGAEAVHPGYGFLSENADFSQLCERNNICFIGPPAQAIRIMGSKSAAKQAMEAAGVPILPGLHATNPSAEELLESAQAMGFPVLLKAVSGGGGKGMRRVDDPADFTEALATAKREAQSSFGDDTMLVEKFLEQPRHVEVQVFCDTQGNGVYLFERDCSVQRRHQKIIEEAPAPGLSAELRVRMGEAALQAAAAVNYVGAGTVEFLLSRDGNFYFMEMNTRLQVEHPVTEMITGVDLVAWQLDIAAGQPLPLAQADLSIKGHSFEARIYAEDPDNDFLPTAGRVQCLQQPAASAHVRVDTGVVGGDEVGVFYDPMIAKLIVWHEDRGAALQTLAAALSNYRITGLTTNVSFLQRLIDSDAFRAAQLSTDFIERNHEALFGGDEMDTTLAVPMAAAYLLQQQNSAKRHQGDATSPWYRSDNWRLNTEPLRLLRLTLNDEDYELVVEEQAPGQFLMRYSGLQQLVYAALVEDQLAVTIEGRTQSAVVLPEDDSHRLFVGLNSLRFSAREPDTGAAAEDQLATDFKAPMNGSVVDIRVQPGQRVAAGDLVIILEAMKMEHSIHAPSDGVVTEVFYATGDLVTGGAELIGFERDS